MRIAVMGTGAIGGYVGARLARAGAAVTFIARGAHLAAIRQHGLKIASPLGDQLVAPAEASDDPAAVGPVDLVLLGVKLYDVETAVEALRPMLGPETGVVTLQNGVDAPELVERLAGPGRAVPGVVMINAEIAAPGTIQHNALNTLILGESDGRASERLTRLAELGAAGGVEIKVSPEIRLELWRKFLLMASMGGVSAATRVPLERLRTTPETLRLAEAAMHEVVAVAAAHGVDLGADAVARGLGFVESMPGTWKASLTVDLELGKRLEVEWLSGAVCRLGRAAGVATPAHQALLAVLLPHAQGAA